MDGEDSTFEPRVAQWFYRIVCMRLMNSDGTARLDLPTSRFRVKNELHTQYYQTKPQTRETNALPGMGVLKDSRKALFDLHPALEGGYDPTEAWPKMKTDWEYLDDLVYQVPGFDGPNGYLEDDVFGVTVVDYNDKGVSGAKLNTAFYTRYYGFKMKDAMGRTGQKRQFNDYVFAAQTTHPRIFPRSVCSEMDDDVLEVSDDPGDESRNALCEDKGDRDACEATAWAASELVGTAVKAKCAWNPVGAGRCYYQKCWTQRWTYMLPLEIIYMTPLTNWDPYDIGYCDSSMACYHTVKTHKGVKNAAKGTKKKPYNGARPDTFYRTPEEFYTQTDTQTDEADTSGGVTYVNDQQGNVHRVVASGHWILMPEIAGIGELRQRYPSSPSTSTARRFGRS